MADAYKPMAGRPDRMKWNCENPALQSTGGKKGMKRKMDSNLLDALWDEVIAHRMATFRWTRES